MKLFKLPHYNHSETLVRIIMNFNSIFRRDSNIIYITKNISQNPWLMEHHKPWNQFKVGKLEFVEGKTLQIKPIYLSRRSMEEITNFKGENSKP